MRRPNRNIEIFSMSVLDLFAAALGAFILISVILFPNYMKQKKVELQLEAAKQTINECKSATSVKDKTLAVCAASPETTFLVVSIEWSIPGNIDIDLHVTDPKGNEFFWAKNNRTHSDYPSTDAQLSYDNTRGPGVELWQQPKAEPGVYKIAYFYYGTPDRSATPPPVEVKGNVFYRNGRIELPPVILILQHIGYPVADLQVSEAGTVDLKVLQ